MTGVELLSRFDWLIFVLFQTLIGIIGIRWIGFPFPLVTAIVMPWLLLPIFLASSREWGFWAEAGLYLLGIFSSFTGFLIFKDAESVQQKKRDELASAILYAVRSSTPLPVKRYAVYARPFDSTNMLTTQNIDLNEPGSITKVYNVDLETKIRRALETFLPVVALGRPGEMIGAGRVQVDDSEWQEVFALLVEKAALVLALPSSNPGTRWEMKLLLNVARERCILIMPMSPTPSQNFNDKWLNTRFSLEELGVELPIYIDRGALFRLDSNGHPASITYLPRWPVLIPSLRRALVTVAPPHLDLKTRNK